MVDHKEFFAELSVTYLSNGYHSLDKADPTCMENCSPPLLQPYVTDRVLNQYGIIEDPLEGDTTSCWTGISLSTTRGRRGGKPKLRIVDPIFQETALARSCKDVIPCNKFYPFTRGQLQYYDPVLYNAMRDLWRIIAQWDDPEDHRSCAKSVRCFSLFYF